MKEKRWVLVAAVLGSGIVFLDSTVVNVALDFYADLASRLPGVDVSSEQFRKAVGPLNAPSDPRLIAVVHQASTSSLHLAMAITAGLLLAGAIVNAAAGIRNSLARPVSAAR